ncbi:Protein Y18H1A.9 [Aphelenchoides avenae]|nr:Protein Y18H1A.9 [Aphelenchus avenae]
MARADRLEELQAELKERGFGFETMIDDVEKLIKKRANESETRRHRMPMYRDAPFGSRVNFNLGRYHSFADMINFLNALAINYPDRVRVMPIGTTHEGRQVPLIKVGTRKFSNKPAIWLDGGIHAREWVSPAAVIYFIHQLVTGYERDQQLQQLVDRLDWYLVPLLNPDGYEYSRSSADPEIRLWRKNRSPLECTQVSTGLFTPPQTQCCQGVDLNRNFDWFFGQGKFAFSEPETRAVRDFLVSQNGRVKTFLTFHSYSQILMYPFGHALRTYPNDVDDLSRTALKAAQKLQAQYGTKYTVGTGADTLYPASGGSEDFAKGRMNVKYSYLFELRPEDNVWDGFLLAENQIIPTARETWEAVKSIALDTMNTFQPATPNVIAGGSANVQRACRDLDQLCPYWAENGACQAWPSMKERCPRSCGFC